VETQLEFETQPEAELDGSEAVVCATSRLARELRGWHDTRQARRGLKQWPTLQTCTLGQWLENEAEAARLRGEATTGALSHPVLGSFEEQLLWEQIIAESLDEGSAPLFDIAAMATTAAEAHALSTLWEIDAAGGLQTEESRNFRRWQARFRQRCDAAGIIDAASYRKAVVAHLGKGNPDLPARLVLAGFDRLSPLESRLCDTLAGRGVRLLALETETKGAGLLEARSYPDLAAECLAVALWARARLEADPKAMLGVIVPDLAGARDTLQDTLEDVLAPASLRPANAEAPRPFNFSLGRDLAAYPIVSTALDLLRLWSARDGFEQALAGGLLNSPYWSADATEMDGRARVEAAMREGLGWHTSLKRLASYARWLAGEEALAIDGLLTHLDGLEQAAARLPRRAPPSEWGERFAAALSRAGWPGERGLSSHEHQARQAFLEILAGLGSLDRVLGPVGPGEALSRLGQLCRQRIFQPLTLGQPPIQVLGVLEAAGMQFSALWVMGMNDSAWPPPARPNPLLPAEVQARVRAPNASAEVQVAFAQAIHGRLLNSAPDVSFSWPRSEGASELRPSPLLGSLLPGEACDAPPSPTWVARAAASQGAALAPPIEDTQAPPPQDDEKVPGGTGLLKAQAICPAWAYFQYRLGAVRLKEPVEGLDPMTRGTLVHGALEAFWKLVRSSERLLAMGDGERAATVEQVVDQVLDAFGEDRKREPLPARFKRLERSRMTKLLADWLALESSRGQAFTVVDCERRVRASIEGITVNMSIDRIDQLEDGRLLVIDYKTGARIDFKNWASARITEPQLPIYAAIAKPGEGEVAAVAFAKVVLAEPGFAGIAEDEGLLPGVAALASKAGERYFPSQQFPNWPALLAHWQATVSAIAREVKCGHAAVVFTSEDDLKYCEVLPLLRLPECRSQLASQEPGGQP
jgi:exodeoxyribonuclease-5